MRPLRPHHPYQVTRNRKWADLGRLLGYGGVPGLATQLKNSYARVILPYEHFCDHVRNSPNMSPAKQHDPNLKTHTNIQTASKSARSSVERDNDSPPSSPLSTSSSDLSDLPDEADPRLRRSVRQGADQPTRKHLCCLAAASGLIFSPQRCASAPPRRTATAKPPLRCATPILLS